MAGLVRTQVEFDSPSGLAEDRMVNTFHHITGANTPTGAQLDAIRDRIVAGFNDIQAPSPDPLENYLSASHYSGVWRLKHYDLLTPEPRVPIRVDTPANLGPAGGLALPREVALCMSYKGGPTGGVPLSRQRGRIYFGGLAATANGAAGRPVTNLRLALAGFGSMLIAASNADAEWVVYSPTRFPVPTATDSHPVVTSGHVDDAWDTQRRRGQSASTRTVFP